MNAPSPLLKVPNNSRQQTRIYFDHAATSPLLSEVKAAMEPFWAQDFGNPSNPYAISRSARAAIDTARNQVARLIGAHADEIAFTGGGTESDNWALLGVALAHLGSGRNHVILSAVEHDAVLEAQGLLEQLGFDVSIAPVDEDGVCQPQFVEKLLRPETCLVSVMSVNNETGTLQPIEAVSQVLAESANKIVLHSDAVQAIGKISVSAHECGADLLTLSAHKIGGPKGVGALWIKRDTPMRALIRGGGQERGRRAGTENVPGIVGFGKACEIAKRDFVHNSKYLQLLREHLERALDEFSGVQINGAGSARAPHVVNFSLDSGRAESIALRLDLAGIAVGTGSACSSGALEPSHVLAAMGVSAERARRSLRVSFGTQNTPHEIDELMEKLREFVN